jgi:hypothetical protein
MLVMKKFWPVIVALVIAMAGGVYLAVKPDSSSTNKPAYTFKKACDILTEGRAKQLLGSDITRDTNNQNAASRDIDVSSCGFAQQFSSNTPASQVKGALVAEILVRAAKSDAGAESNQLEFGAHKPTGVLNVAGYGKAAFWDPSVGALYILKNHNQYILSYGKIQALHTLDQTKKLADLITNDL